MSDQLEVLKLVAQRLDGMAIPYMVSGSMAMNYYAEPRMTRDIDVVVALEPSDAARVVAAFGDDFYLDEDALRGAIAQRGTFNLIHDQRVVKVDFIVRKDTEFRRTEFSRRRPVRIDDSTVWIVSPEDLLLSKLVWGKDSGSDMQRRDARNLVECVTALDREYLQHWANELGVAELLREVCT